MRFSQWAQFPIFSNFLFWSHIYFKSPFGTYIHTELHILACREQFIIASYKMFKKKMVLILKQTKLLHWNSIISADFQSHVFDRITGTKCGSVCPDFQPRHRIPPNWFGESLLAFLLPSSHPPAHVMYVHKRFDCVYFLHSFRALRSETIDRVFNIPPMFYEACSKHGPLRRPLTIPTGED